ncbi:MAG: rhodanese-like domain-containing protein [Gammaproteobacteria bacterium]|nr:rhodanese-like domain-containing protein [Gammaproteobacteria bacterium]
MDQIGDFILNHWLLFLSLVIILSLLAASVTKDRLLGFKEIKPAEAVEMINHQNAAVLDVREPAEFSAGHILNSVNVPLAALEDRIGELEAWRGRPVIVYCRTGSRAARASALLRKKDFATVVKLSGGILAWESAGLPLNRA